MAHSRIVREALKRTLTIVQAGWTQGTWARDRWSHEVSTSSPRACRFCLSAAVSRATQRNNYQTRQDVLNALGNVIGKYNTVVGFNDAPGRKKSEVIAVINQALGVKS